MENNRQKEQWIDEVLHSTQGMLRAEPSAGFMAGIEAKLRHPQGKKSLSFPIKWAAAAVLLLALNIGSVVYATGKAHKAATPAPADTNPFARDLQSQNLYNY